MENHLSQIQVNVLEIKDTTMIYVGPIPKYPSTIQHRLNLDYDRSHLTFARPLQLEFDRLHRKPVI